jgi:hypothetical protein
VNSFSTFKWLAVILPLLLLSVAWKIVTAINQHEPKNALIDFFEHNHFVVTEQTLYGVLIIQAKADSCQLQAIRLAPDGSNGDLVRHLFDFTDRFFVVFNGRMYAQQPVFWTVINNVWSVSLGQLGLASHAAPIIGVAANPSCDAERLPWDELGHS